MRRRRRRAGPGRISSHRISRPAGAPAAAQNIHCGAMPPPRGMLGASDRRCGHWSVPAGPPGRGRCPGRGGSVAGSRPGGVYGHRSLSHVKPDPASGPGGPTMTVTVTRVGHRDGHWH